MKAPQISDFRFRVEMIGFEQKSGSPVITIGLAIVDGLTHRIFFYSEAYRPIALYQLGDKKQTQRLLLLHLITVPMTREIVLSSPVSYY